MKEQDKCWHFIMSSFARTYGVPRTKWDQKIHEFALQWCDDHDYKCDIYLGDLKELDTYLRQEYENWEG